MRLTFQVLLLGVLVAFTGCKSHAPNYDAVPAPVTKTSSSRPIVKPSDELVGKVVSFNGIGRFAVLNFPVTRMPAVGQTLFLYRDGLKVGEIKITGPQKDDNIVGDLVSGEGKNGDAVRDR